VPIYEYQCGKCGEKTEAMQKMSDPPLKKCPRCGGPLSKVMSSTSFVLKGSGWYATDYAKKGNGSGNGKSSKGVDVKDRLKDVGEKKEKEGKETPATTDKSADPPPKTSKAAADD
jgi:putative FmdB family regulatory protein